MVQNKDDADLQDLSWSWGDLCSALGDASEFAHQDAKLRLGTSEATKPTGI